MFTKHSHHINDWAQCCAMLTNTEPFSDKVGVTYGVQLVLGYNSAFFVQFRNSHLRRYVSAKRVHHQMVHDSAVAEFGQTSESGQKMRVCVLVSWFLGSWFLVCKARCSSAKSAVCCSDARHITARNCIRTMMLTTATTACASCASAVFSGHTDRMLSIRCVAYTS